MSALIHFEAAARLSSFTNAARELNVTQAAVSRQIRALESELGFKLFRRGHRSIELTSQGVVLSKTMSKALSEIAQTLDDLSPAPQDKEELVISALVAFSNLWLAPKLSSFCSRYPHLKVRVITQDREISLVDGTIDVALRFGNGLWPDGVSTLLFHDEVFPVCSPSYIEKHGEPPTAAHFPDHRLIAYEQAARDWVDWDDWLSTCGYSGPSIKVDAWYSYYTDAVSAALDGQGIILGWRALIEKQLATGNLKALTTDRIRTSSAHFAVLSRVSSDKPGALAFIEWLRSEINVAGDLL